MTQDIAIATDPSDLQPGEIQFFSSSRPPLRSGQYRISSEQVVNGVKDQAGKTPKYIDQKPFVISGPRFTLDPSLIQMFYPPGDAQGNYDLTLPNITLRRRSLPWERTLSDSATSPDDPTPPWLALITLYPEDMDGVAPTRITVEQLLNPSEPNVLPPAINPDTVTTDELAQELLAIDLDLQIFRNISPELDELPWLANVREVNTGGKEILGLDEDGWFSVIVANRLPKANAESHSFLLSLEGHGEHLHGSPEPPSQYTKIRLVSLATWQYTSANARGSFISIMQALPQRGGVSLLQPVGTYPADATGAVKDAKDAVTLGYMPLVNNTRSGELTSSYYRGPMTPIPTKKDSNGPYYFSDSAIQYDPETGLFNMAFAGAWQIGRLLALADAAFARALFDWRRKVRIQRRTRSLQRSNNANLLSKASPNTLAAVASDKGDTLAIAGFFAHEVAPALEKLIIPKITPHELRDGHKLPGRLSQDDLRRMEEGGEDPLFVLLSHLEN